MSQNSKTAKMVLGRYYRVLNSRLSLTRLAILNTWKNITVYPPPKKIVAMATVVGRGKILMTASDSQGLKIGVGANSVHLSFAGTELYRFEVPIGRNAKFCNF